MAIRAKNVMYVQQMEYLEEDNLADLLKSIENKLSPKKYAGIIHDKDLDEYQNIKASHVHIVMQFENARSLDNLAKLLNEKTQTIEKWDGNVNNAYSYLIHHTENSQLEHQYNVKEVIANFDYPKLINSIQENVSQKSKLSDSVIINNILDLIYSGDISKEKAETLLSGSQYAKASSRIESVYHKKMEMLASNWRREMKNKNEPVTIIWLFGETGSGKTRIAKDYANNFSEVYYLTGSIRDPFQQYKGQSVIILDELRPQAFDYSDLLKMLDPYNDSSMASSRYFDKPLTANIFIITTPYSPKSFFNEIEKSNKINSSIDQFEQLARRLTLVQKMTKENLIPMYFDTLINDFLEEKSFIKENPYINTTLYKNSSKKDAIKIFNTLTGALSNSNDPKNDNQTEEKDN